MSGSRFKTNTKCFLTQHINCETRWMLGSLKLEFRFVQAKPSR